MDGVRVVFEAEQDKERMIMPPEDNDHRWMLEMADRG